MKRRKMEDTDIEVRYLLAELSDLSAHTNSILKSANRIKYTCFDASKQYIVFGSSSGGLYVFSRTPCRFLQLIPNQVGTINQISISPNEEWLAFSTLNGLVYVVRRPTGILPTTPDTQISYEHEANNVTELCWDRHNAQLFIGDDNGRVSVLNLHYLIGRKVLHVSSFLLLELNFPIVQLDVSADLLLVSTITKTVLCNTQKQEFQQIGLRPRRGKYGACFVSSSPTRHIYCARPGRRLWEVDEAGSVICTHQFRRFSTISNRIIQISKDHLSKEPIPPSEDQGTSKNFTKLYPLLNRFILTFTANIIYILDPLNCEVVFCIEDYSNIADCAIVENIIYVFNDSYEFHEIHLMTVEELIMKSYYIQNYYLCAYLSQEHSDYLVQHAKKSGILSKLLRVKDVLTNYGVETNLDPIFSEIPETGFETGKEFVDNNSSEESSSNDDIFQEEILYKRQRHKFIATEQYNQSNDSKNNDDIAMSTSKVFEDDAICNRKINTSICLIKEAVENTDLEVLKDEDNYSFEEFPFKEHVLPLKPISNSNSYVSSSLLSYKEDSLSNENVIEKVAEDCDNIDIDNEQLSDKAIEEKSHGLNYELVNSQTKEMESMSDTPDYEDLSIKVDFSGKNELCELKQNSEVQLENIRTSEMESKTNSCTEYSENLGAMHDTVILEINVVSDHLKQNEIEVKRNSSIQNNSLSNNVAISEIFSNISTPNSIIRNEKCPSVVESLYSVIEETRQDNCTIPNKLPILVEYDSTGIIDIFRKLYTYALEKEQNKELVEYECSKLFLQFITLRLDILDTIEIIQDHLILSVVSVESSRSKTCVCGYPIPQNTKKPLFYGLCKKVYDLFSDDINKRIDLCGRIPYMWHLIVDQEKDPSLNVLSLIMQLDYKKGFESISKNLTEDDYMDIIDYKLTLTSNRCLLCFSKFQDSLCSSEEYHSSISWNFIGNCMYRSFGGTNTLNILINKSNEIPHGSFDLDFYHFLMLNP